MIINFCFILFIVFKRPVAFSNVKELCYPTSPLRNFPSRAFLDEGTIRKYTRQILHALLYLHTHHVAHRNLKCTNILIDGKGDGKILLSDYGGYHRKLYDYLSDVRHKNEHYYLGHITQQGITSHSLARKDDVYHLALCIISMAGGTVDEIGEGGEINSLPDHLSRSAKEFLQSCLKKDPQERPEVASLLKHPFSTQPYTPAYPLTHSLSQPVMTSHSILPIPGIDSHPSTSASSASVSTAGSYASSNQSHAPIPHNITSSDTSSSTNAPPLTRREITKKNKSANALASAFAAARSDDDDSTNSSISTTSIHNSRIPSRYRQDFEELEIIGRGGFGIVVKARNRLDGR